MGEYEITKVEDMPNGGLHVEYEFTNPETGNIEKNQMNFGEDMKLNDQWKSHLDEYVKKTCEHCQNRKLQKEGKAQKPDYSKFIKKHSINSEKANE